MNPKTLRGQFGIAQQQMRKSSEYKKASIFEKRAMDKDLEDRLKQAQKEEKQRQIAAAQEAMAAEEQERAKKNTAFLERQKELAEYSAKNSGDLELSAMAGAKQMFAEGGGTIGGVFGARVKGSGRQTPTMRPEFELYPLFPRYKQDPRLMGLIAPKEQYKVIPSGAGSRQELSYFRKSAEKAGIPWVETPVEYKKKTIGGKEGWYNQMGQRFTGTLMGRGSSSGINNDEPKKQPPPTEPPPPPPIPPSSMGVTGDPISFTGFGSMAGLFPRPTSPIVPTSPIAQSPFSGSSGGFKFGGYGSIPQFPYFRY